MRDSGDPAGTPGNALTSASATVTINVANPNDAPIAGGITVSAKKNQTIVIPIADLLANASDPDGNPINVVSVANASHGTATLFAERGFVLFTPAADFVGTASFDAIISDGSLTAAGHVTLNIVNGSNTTPIANGNSGAVNEDTNFLVSEATLLSNDSDIDGDVLRVTGVGNGSHGTASFDAVTGAVKFTPDADFNGVATFDYTVTDGLVSAIGHVSVTVAPVDDAPRPQGDHFATPARTPIDISVGSLLSKRQ